MLNTNASAKADRLPVVPQTTQSLPATKIGRGAAPKIGITSATELKIKFLGYKELTGLYKVNADATISIPVLGRISVSNMDAASLEKILSREVTEVTGRKGFAAVEITVYKPVFVTGVVKFSKSYPWTPGMTVLHAVSLAGGTSLGNVNINLSTNQEMANLRHASNNLKRSIAVQARLQAERAGRAKIKLPPRLVELVGRREAEQIIGAQITLLRSNNRAFDSQDKAVRQAIETARVELLAMESQQALIKRQIRLQRAQYTKLKKLKRKGLISVTTVLDREARIAETQEKSINTLVAHARLSGRLLDLQRELLNVKQKKEARINKNLFEQDRNIASQEIKLSAARRAVMTLNKGARFSLDAQEKNSRLFQIVRETSKEALTLDVNKFTRLWPGDIVVVK